MVVSRTGGLRPGRGGVQHEAGRGGAGLQAAAPPVGDGLEAALPAEVEGLLLVRLGARGAPNQVVHCGSHLSAGSCRRGTSCSRLCC